MSKGWSSTAIPSANWSWWSSNTSEHDATRYREGPELEPSGKSGFTHTGEIVRAPKNADGTNVRLVLVEYIGQATEREESITLPVSPNMAQEIISPRRDAFELSRGKQVIVGCLMNQCLVLNPDANKKHKGRRL